MPDLGGVERRIHHALLDQKHPVLDRIDDGEIAIDDEIEDGIKNVIGAVSQLAGQGFEPGPDVGVRARRPVADTDEEMGAKEKGGFARMDRIGVEVGGAGDNEQLVAIGFDLRQLVRLQRILDRERVEAEAFRNPFELARRRLVKAKPKEIAIVAIFGNRFVRADVADKLAVMINAGGHNRHRQNLR